MGRTLERRARVVATIGLPFALVGLLATAALAVFVESTVVGANTLTTETLQPPSGLDVTQSCSGGGGGGGGSPTFRAAATGGSASGPTVAVPRPLGTVSGDVLIAGISWDGQTGTITSPGWAFLRSDVEGGENWQGLFYKVVGAAEPLNYTFTSTSATSGDAAAAIVAFSGVDPSSPVDAHGGQVNAGSSTITAPSITTTTPNTTLVGFFGRFAGNPTISPPPSMTEIAESNFGHGTTIESARQSWAGVGPTGSRTATATGSDDNVGQLIALRPGGGGGAPSGSATWSGLTPSLFASGYLLQRYNGAVLENSVTVTPRTSTSATDGPLTAGVTYTYRLVAYYQSWTSVATVDTLTPLPC